MKLTIAKRMMLVIGTALLGVSIMTSVSQRMMQDVYDSVNYTNINTIPSLIILAELRKNYAVTRIDVYRHIIASTPQEMTKIEVEINADRRNITTSFSLYEVNGCLGISCISDAKDRELFEQEKALWDELSATINPILIESRKGPQGFSNARDLLNVSNPLSKQFVTLINRHFEYNAEIGRNVANSALHIKMRAILLMLFFGLLMLITIAALGYFNTWKIIKKLGGEPDEAANIATQLALGDLSGKIRLAPGDSTSLMAKISQLMDMMGLVAARADAVGNGNLTDGITILSEQDRLGKAINNMVKMLRRAKAQDDERNWFNEGNQQLSHALTGDFSERQVADAAVSVLGRYLDAGRGVLYIPRQNEAVLDLVGSYMYSEAIHNVNSFAFGEGAIGQVAKEMRPIFWAAGEDNIAPLALAPILTGTSSTPPRYTYTYPLLRENQLSGVVELASITPFDQYKLDFLVEATAIIASFMYVARQREQIHALLRIAEQAERDVRQQNDHLYTINIQMEQQQQQLMQQAEELQQSNAQLEEQHQQLQLQSEEMQQINTQMEEQQLLLEQSNKELLSSEIEINEKVTQLALSNHYKSEFLANMSHELRTPLNAIMLLSKMMMENADAVLDTVHIKRAEVIHRSGQDLLLLINDVLDLSKVDAGRMDLNIVEIASVTVVSELVDLFTATAQHNGIEFIVEDRLQDTLISDPVKLSQILRNFLSNAFKFTKTGSVTLRLERHPNTPLPIRISVQDTGIGIPASQQDAIFEAFHQVDGSTSREYGGTGLGLTISLRFAKLLGGLITLESTEGTGSTITLCLPSLLPETRHTQQNHQLSNNADAKLSAITDDREHLQVDDNVILLIDDDPHFGMAIVECNHRLGYKTIVAVTAAQGLALAKHYRPTGILLDLGLPDRNGADLLYEMKNSSELAAIPVYIISASDREEAASMTSGNSIIGYLQKPVSANQVAHAEAVLLATMTKAPSANVLVVSKTQTANDDTTTTAASDTVLMLLLSTTPESQDILHHYHTHRVDPGDTLKTALDAQPWGVVVIDLGGLSIPKGLAIANTVITCQPGTALLFCGIDYINDEDEASLRNYTECIIVNSPHSGKRLLDNIERFLDAVPRTSLAVTDAIKNVSTTKRLLGQCILVIDDDPRNLFVITAALEQQGANVINALNGRRALEMLNNISVNLIITDIMMPEMDGYQTITALRANPAWMSIPIIALTAKTLPEERKNILEIGADDFLTKPVDYDVLSNMAVLWCAKKH